MTVAYITKQDESIETRTFIEGNEQHKRSLLYLLNEIANNNPYRRVTFENVPQ